MLRREEIGHNRAKQPTPPGTGFEKAVRKFLRKFPGGFKDETYLAWERDYKWRAHLEWEEQLNALKLKALLKADAYQEIAARAVKIESSRSLLFSFEKMALRDAVREEMEPAFSPKDCSNTCMAPGPWSSASSIGWLLSIASRASRPAF